MRRLEIMNPCDASWEQMVGDQRIRQCATCCRPVHDLSALREAEARAHLLLFSAPGLCVRFTCDVDGEILHSTGRLSARRQGLPEAHQPLAAGLLAAALSMAAGRSALADHNVTAVPSAQAPHAQAALPPTSVKPAVDPAQGSASEDRDGDGIADADDACPTLAGPPAASPAQNGCPKPKVVTVVQGGARPIEVIRFARSAQAFSAPSRLVLEEVARVLQQHGEIKKVAVQGHASKDEPKAKQLGEARARGVVAALVAAHVDPARLVVESYGSERPIDDNTTSQGQARNRRVDFRIIGSEQSCPPKAEPKP